MKVIDAKEPFLLNVWLQRIKYSILDRQLRCSGSLKEQKAVLREFYAVSSFKRNSLLARQYTLNNRKTIGLKEQIFSYKDFLIAFAASLLTVFLEKLINEDWNLCAVISNSLVLGLILFITIVLLVASAFIDKEKCIRKDIPMQEVCDFELWMINRALACGLEDIDYDDLIETNNHCVKTKRRIKRPLKVVVITDLHFKE